MDYMKNDEKLNIEYVNIDDVFMYENNAKEHTDKQIDDIVTSIRKYGMNDPIAVWKDNVIIEGHGRLLACKQLGFTEVPIIHLDSLTDEKRREYMIVHNQTTMETGWDFSKLEQELADLDFSDFSFDFGGIEDDAQSGGVQEVDAPEPPEEPKSKVGDLYALGNHRLICGDSTDAAVIDRLMDGVKADMVMTDPPYGINAEKMTMGSGAKEFYRGKDWDSERPDISIAFTLADNICIWGGNYFTDVLPISNDWLVWHKKNDGLSFSECELAWTNFGRNVRHISHHWGNEKKLHVTMKPVEVIAWAIQQAKEKAEVIVDLFGGSGSTLIASEQLNRKCYMAELDPKYVSVIVNRWLNFTGRKDEIFCIRDGQKLTYDEVFGE